MDRFFFVMGSIMGFIGVALGEFAAHGLRSRLPNDLVEIFETGVRYQMYHALALLAVAWAASRWPNTSTHAAGWAFIVGIVVFSGSLYLLSVTGIRWLGAITPFGGVAFLVGWVLLIWSAWR